MSGGNRAFLDTNIFVYAYDNRDPLKQSIALNLVRDLMNADEAVISYQVVQEFFNVALVKSRNKLTIESADLILRDVFRPLIFVPSTIALISSALALERRYLLSWYDSLIVAAAQYAGCSVLYSEDLQHGQQFGTVKVTNPFL
ncbi:MAG TPA: PIN domain-containing protein [Acidobacteriaceae bacterium]|nr:PIN domain-containing protein [Acidobacteriaceae bacterium]